MHRNKNAFILHKKLLVTQTKEQKKVSYIHVIMNFVFVSFFLSGVNVIYLYSIVCACTHVLRKKR